MSLVKKDCIVAAQPYVVYFLNHFLTHCPPATFLYFLNKLLFCVCAMEAMKEYVPSLPPPYCSFIFFRQISPAAVGTEELVHHLRKTRTTKL